MTFDLVISAASALVDGQFPPADIGILVRRIAAIGADTDAALVVLRHDELLIPGIVDSDVYVNEPGHTEWEGHASAIRAVGDGGVTPIIDMALDSIPTTISSEALLAKRLR